MLPDLHHFRGEDTGCTVQRWKGLVKHGHMPAYGPRPFQEVDFLAGIGNFKGCLYTSDPSPDNQCVWVDIQILWYGCHFKWYIKNCAGKYCLRQFRILLPGSILFPETHCGYLGRIITGYCHGFGEHRADKTGCLACQDDPCDPLVTDRLGYLIGIQKVHVTSFPNMGHFIHALSKSIQFI